MKINSDDLKIESVGGFSGPVIINGELKYPHCAVKITHIPTGISTECGDFHTQHRNKTAAYKKLLEKLTKDDPGEGSEET